MSDIIIIPIAPILHAIHWGSSSNFERFINKGFFTDSISKKKQVITHVKYEPDNIYQRVDGMAGRCWIVHLQEESGEKTTKKYYIRNWIDIVHHYEQKGFKFEEN